MFYTENLTRKVELCIFSLVSLMKKYQQSNFSRQNSVENNYFKSTVHSFKAKLHDFKTRKLFKT